MIDQDNLYGVTQNEWKEFFHNHSLLKGIVISHNPKDSPRATRESFVLNMFESPRDEAENGFDFNTGSLNTRMFSQISHHKDVIKYLDVGVDSESFSIGTPILFDARIGYSGSYSKSGSRSRKKIYCCSIVSNDKLDITLHPEQIKLNQSKDPDNVTITSRLQSIVNGNETSNVKLNNIIMVLKDYGQYIPTKFIMGGAAIMTQVAVSNCYKMDEAIYQNFKATIKAKFEAAGVPIEPGAGTHIDQTNHNTYEGINTFNDFTLEFKGGNAKSFNGIQSFDAWAETLQPANWTVTRVLEMIPTIQFLQDEELLRKITTILVDYGFVEYAKAGVIANNGSIPMG